MPDEQSEKNRKVIEIVPLDADQLAEIVGGIGGTAPDRDWGWWYVEPPPPKRL
jgi:hypothetical protein